MGQKVNPIGFRLGVNKDWDSKWYAGKDYAEVLNKDIKIREYLEKTLKDAAVASILIERKNQESMLLLILLSLVLLLVKVEKTSKN